MYFGSVNFFKQLIYSTVICSSVSAAAFSVIFGIKCAADNEDSHTELPTPVKQVIASSDGSGTSDGQSVKPADDVPTITEAPAESGIVIPENAPIEEVYSALTENGYSSDEIFSYISGLEENAQTQPSVTSEAALTDKTDASPSDYGDISANTDVPADNAPAAETAPQGGNTPSEGNGGDLLINENIRSDAPVYDSDISDFPDLYTLSVNKAAGDDEFFLMFSDSPSDCTNDLLTILSSQNINAVFLADAGTDGFSDRLLNKIASEKHSFGIELNKSYTDLYECLSDINTTFESIYGSTGVKPNVLSCREQLPENISAELESRGFTVLTPDIYGDDVPDPDWSSVYNNTIDLAEGGNGSVISLKGGSDDIVTLYTAEDIISRLKSDGYSFAVPGRE